MSGEWTSPVLYQTREAWLEAGIEVMRIWFKEIGVTLPDRIRVSCAWAKGARKGAIAWCWQTEASADGTTELQVSPEISGAIQVLGSLVHELIHASDNGKSKHAGYFKNTARAIGLEGKMTATVPGAILEEKLAGLAGGLGAYPHAVLNPMTPIDGKPKQSTRMLKVTCPMEGYTVRMTRKWIAVGLPYCPCGMEMELEDKEDGDGE
jgi:hypothetical protein